MGLDKYLNQLFDQSTVGMLFIDELGIIAEVNPVGQRILGYDESKLRNSRLSDIGPSLETLFNKEINDNHEGLLGYQYHKILKGGKDLITLKIRPQKLKNINGDSSFVLFFTDVLKNELSDEQLMSGDLMFQKLAEVAPVGIFLTDVDGNAIFLNKRWQDIAGMTQEQGKREGWRQAIYPDDVEDVFSSWKEYVGSTGTWEFDYRYQNVANGKITFVKATSAPFTDSNDNIIGYVGTIQDISFIKKSISDLSSLNSQLEQIVVERTQELIRKKDELSEAIEISRIGHWHLDLSSAEPVFTFSDRYKAIFEISPNLQVDDPHYFLQFIHPDDVQEVQNASETAIRQGQHVNIDYRIITPKGNLKFLWTKIRVDTNNDNQPLKVDAVVQDVTAIKAHEEQLRQALERERELGELKSRFVSMASHEFRTPLTTILSSIELIELYGSQEKFSGQKKHIKRVSTAVNNLTTILEDFLSLERLETNNVQVNQEAISLYKVINTVKDELSIVYKDTNIIININGDLTVTTDKQLLKNVLRNLLSNALKYSPSGSPVTIDVRQKNDQLQIDVIDQGIGIPLKDQQELFSRFYRASNVNNIEGTGLGLVIVKRYLDLMGGTINFKSKYEEGSTFRISLPQ